MEALNTPLSGDHALTFTFRTADGEYFTALRLVAGTVCSAQDLDIDAAEDFKVCVTEATLILKNNGFSAVSAVFTRTADHVCCMLVGQEGIDLHEEDNDISLALIGALVTDYRTQKQDDVTAVIALEL